MARGRGSSRSLSSLLFVVMVGFLPAMVFAEGGATKDGKLKYELIPIDPSRKVKEESAQKVKGVEVLEQKGLGSPGFPSDDEKKKSEDGRSLKEVCAEFEGKIVSFVEYVSLVQNCKQRRVEEQQLLNELLVLRNTSIVDIPSHVFRIIPTGLPFRRKDFLELQKSGGPDVSALCRRNNGRYVTTDGVLFYLISDCKRRPITNFQSLVDDANNGRPVLVWSPDELEMIPEGTEIVSKEKDESSVLYKVDGDVIWSRLYEGKVDRKSEDSLELLKKIEAELVARLDRKEVCSALEGKIISFFSKLYFVEKCLRRPLEGISLSIQAQIMDDKGISDVTSGQYRLLPEGVFIKEPELREKFKL